LNQKLLRRIRTDAIIVSFLHPVRPFARDRAVCAGPYLILMMIFRRVCDGDGIDLVFGKTLTETI
jgi:hypothetical protein